MQILKINRKIKTNIFVICTMYIRFGTLALSSFLGIMVMAQIPELEIIKNKAVSPSLSAIQKARIAFFNGENLLAETLFFTELESGNFEENDYLLFANSLLRDGRPALAEEFYTTYFKKNALKKVQEKAQLSSILHTNTNTMERSVLVKNNLTNPTLFQNNLYGANEGKLISYSFDCDQNIANKVDITIPLRDMKIGSISLFENGNSAIVSLLNPTTNKFGLYLLKKKNEKWSSPSKLIADKLYNYAFPMVDEQNNMVYFSSDMAGGYGGYDIYQSILGTKTIETPINIGAIINTAGHEINAYKSENWLFFSTNGKLSKGGFDIYKFKSLSESNYILQNYVEINTEYDELTIFPFNQQKCILGHSIDGSYFITAFEKSTPAMFIEGFVYNEKKKPIANAAILIQRENDKGQYVTTDNNGAYTLTLEDKQSDLVATIMADGYKSANVDIVKIKDITLQYADNTQKDLNEAIAMYSYTIPAEKKNADTEVENERITTNSTSSTSAYPSEITLEPQKLINPNSLTINDLYYIIIGSAATKSQAQSFLLKWINKFDNLEILESEKGAYRIGLYAGSTESEAKRAYENARQIKSEVWILRPKSRN